MEEIEKYTFDEWWNGDVILIDSTREINKNDEQKFAQWNDFINSDIEKIKQKQLELFTSNVSKLVEQHSEQFKKRYNASQMKSEYLDSEINECKHIMFGKIPNVKIVGLKHWGISLDHQYLTDIQYYIDRTIKKGVDDGLGFIHSPNCKYQDDTKPDSRIYARFVWEYFNWLESWIAKDNEPNNLKNSNEKKETRTWFKVGLLFANGEMDKLIAKHTTNKMANCTQIALELGNKNFRPYISESISNRNQNNKNIFSNKSKIFCIIEYCQKRNIPVVESFKAYVK